MGLGTCDRRLDRSRVVAARHDRDGTDPVRPLGVNVGRAQSVTMSIGVAGVDLVAAAEADAVGRQLGLFDAPAENPERIRRLTKAVDALRDRFGFTILRRPSSGTDAPDAPARTVWVQPPPCRGGPPSRQAPD